MRRPALRRIVPRVGPERSRVNHIVILDGTDSSLVQGNETNAGLLYKLLRETAPAVDLNLHYEAGVAWDSWRSTSQVISGQGINGRIKRAYGAIASRYQPGDRIYLFGFSRGAYAVRSLAGIIGRAGLLKPSHATERNITQVFRHYEYMPSPSVTEAFIAEHCQRDVRIEMIGAWDTVKSLGMRVPFLWRFSETKFQFHDHDLGPHVKNGYHALALDERRDAFQPILWDKPDAFDGHIEQVWFRGTHGDVGGQLGGMNQCRPLSNIPLVWMCEKAEDCGVRFPPGWQKRFDTDPMAPSVGSLNGWGLLFLARHRRVVGTHPSEALHPSVVAYYEARRRVVPDLPVAVA